VPALPGRADRVLFFAGDYITADDVADDGELWGFVT
jgi:hypothetical protein